MAYKDKQEAREYQRDWVRQKRQKNAVEPDNNVGWKCDGCGEITYHPQAKKDATTEIRTGTLCVECMRGRLPNL